MNGRINDLGNLIERQENCRAKHIESVVIHERYKGMAVWDGVVETFHLDGHAKTKRAYAWVIPPASKDEEPQYTYVLGVPPIKSAEDAARASIAKGKTELIDIARKIKFGE